MPRDFYPRREADVLTFTGTLANRLATDWAALGIPEETAGEYVATQSAFAELYAASVDPNRRTPSVNARKRTAARSLETATRAVAARIRANPDIPLVTKVAVSILPAKTTHTRIAKPDFAPRVEIASTGPRSMTVRCLDPDRPWRRALPKGVQMVSVQFAIGEHCPGTGMPGWRTFGTSSRATFTIRLMDEDLPPFAKVWITARFTNPRGEAGPWAVPAGANVPPGLMLGNNTRRAA